jgi:hypothetical protein
MTTITVIDHGMSLSVRYMANRSRGMCYLMNRSMCRIPRGNVWNTDQRYVLYTDQIRGMCHPLISIRHIPLISIRHIPLISIWHIPLISIWHIPLISRWHIPLIWSERNFTCTSYLISLPVKWHLITKLTPGVLLPPDHRHEFKILIPQVLSQIPLRI